MDLHSRTYDPAIRDRGQRNDFSQMDAESPSLLSVRTVFAAADHAASKSPDFVAETAFSERLTEYLALQGSTTFFLQAISGMTVEVEVLHQYVEKLPDKGDILRRLSRLYVRHARNIILVAESAVQLSFLDARQQQTLIARKEGIGKLLDPGNCGLLKKNDIETVRVHAPSSLHTNLDWAISRHFALKFKGVHCAEIRELVNNESLERAQ
jgi:chorismate-pyruvate lyase